MRSEFKAIKQKKGFGLIEILIVSAVIAVAFVGIFSFLLSSRGIIFQVSRSSQATSLAEEGMEAVRSLRDASWTSNIVTLSPGTTYYPVISANKWTLSTTNPGLVKNLYTRTVVLASVNRDANDDIASSGTADPNTKKVTVTVNWKENQQTKNVTLTSYVTNFLGN